MDRRASSVIIETRFNGRMTNSFHKNIFEGRPFSSNLSEGVFQKCTDVRTGLGIPIYLFESGWDCPAGACRKIESKKFSENLEKNFRSKKFFRS